MADQKLTALTEDTSPSSTDIVYSVKDPGGTPLLRKVEHGNLAVEGTSIRSTGEAGGTKFLREDGDGTCSWQAAGGGGGSGGYGTTEGRLTLESGVAVSPTDQTAKTTLYFTPYKGNLSMLYDGSSAWVATNNAELSIAVPSTTVTPFDVFLDYNAGTPVLKVTDWTNDTTRATALTTQDGVLVQTGNTDWKYLGTCRTAGVSGQCEDSSAKRFVWNYYNRTIRDLNYWQNTTSWTYATSTFRYANNDSNAKVEVVIGVVEDAVQLSVVASVISGGSPYGIIGIGENSSSALHSDCKRQGGGFSTGWYNFCSTLSTIPAAIGYTYFSYLEWAFGGSLTFYGNTGSGDGKAGISGIWRC